MMARWNGKRKILPTDLHEIARKRGEEKQTLQQIGNHYGVSRERIRQILKEQFPAIDTRGAQKAKKREFDRLRSKEQTLCACGCGAIIPKWKKTIWGWGPARRYYPGHISPTWLENVRKASKDPIRRAKLSTAKEKSWAEGKYKNRKFRRDYLHYVNALISFLRTHPGATIKEVLENISFHRSTLTRYMRKLDFIESVRVKEQGRPYHLFLKRDINAYPE